MLDSKEKNIIVVLGAGRTGTSLLMQVLCDLGMATSEIMTPPSEQNLMGGFEDTEIFNLQSGLLKLLCTNQLFPLPEGWIDNPKIGKFKNQLSMIINDRIASSESIWGVKDPRTALFLPLWFQIFNSQKISPRYILAVRSPSSTVRSLKKQYNQGEEISELFWLHKNCEALIHTGCNCFVAHYEDWFSRSEEQAKCLLHYTGLNNFFTGSVEEVLNDVIKPGLNRASYEGYEVKNDHVRRLYDVLFSCKGADFDKAKLMSVVMDCRKAMDGFKGWYVEANKIFSRQVRLNEKNARLRQLVDDLSSAVEDGRVKADGLVKTVELESNKTKSLARQLDMEREKSCDLSKLLEQERQRVNNLSLEVDRVRSSYSWRLGNTLIASFKSPGWKTLRLPYELVNLYKNVPERNNNKNQPKIKNVPLIIDGVGPAICNNANNLEKLKDSLCSQYNSNERKIVDLEQKIELSTSKKNYLSEIEECVFASNAILHQIKNVEDEILEHKIRLRVKRRDSLVRPNKKKSYSESVPQQRSFAVKVLGRMNRISEKFVLGSPSSSRLRQHFFNARKRPGKNTLLFPFRLVRHLLEVIKSALLSISRRFS